MFGVGATHYGARRAAVLTGAATTMKDQRRVSFITIRTFIRTTVVLSIGWGTALAGDANARWSWQEPHARVLPTGDLEWAPQPFEFKAGASIR